MNLIPFGIVSVAVGRAPADLALLIHLVWQNEPVEPFVIRLAGPQKTTLRAVWSHLLRSIIRLIVRRIARARIGLQSTNRSTTPYHQNTIRYTRRQVVVVRFPGTSQGRRIRHIRETPMTSLSRNSRAPVGTTLPSLEDHVWLRIVGWR